MKKFLIVLIMFVLIVVLLTGCGGTVLPPSEPPLDLIREYTGTDIVVRWPDGIVSVVDFIEESKEIWDEVNEIIDGPVHFKLTNDTTAQIGMGYYPYDTWDKVFYVGFPYMSNDAFEMCGILINSTTASEDIYIGAILVALGINIEKWEEGFTQEMKTVLYWLYRLPPGTSLE